MNEQHHGNLLGGAIGETTQAAAQLATIMATAAQRALRLRTRRFEVDRAADQAATCSGWSCALSKLPPGSRGGPPSSAPSAASAAEAATVWAAAQPWVDHDPTADEAARRAEQRLGMLHPELIVRYQQWLAVWPRRRRRYLVGHLHHGRGR